MVPPVGNDPTSQVLHTCANPSQLKQRCLVEAKGIEPFTTDLQNQHPPQMGPAPVNWSKGSDSNRRGLKPVELQSTLFDRSSTLACFINIVNRNLSPRFKIR